MGLFISVNIFYCRFHIRVNFNTFTNKYFIIYYSIVFISSLFSCRKLIILLVQFNNSIKMILIIIKNRTCLQIILISIVYFNFIQNNFIMFFVWHLYIKSNVTSETIDFTQWYWIQDMFECSMTLDVAGGNWVQV